MRGVVAAACAVAFLLGAGRARAEGRAVVAVQDTRYAEPPVDRSVDRPVAAAPEPVDDGGYRSPMRLHLGPTAATTGRGLAPGLGVAADFGRGTIGFRLAAAWTRGEPSGATPSPIGGGLGLYTGELTLDLARRSPVHPIVGIGFGYAHADTGQASGGLGVGTGRIALEYALALDDADVRFQLGVLGALPGPADSAVADLKGWAMMGATLGIGF
jgi:hypothetical protein